MQSIRGAASGTEVINLLQSVSPIALFQILDFI